MHIRQTDFSPYFVQLSANIKPIINHQKCVYFNIFSGSQAFSVCFKKNILSDNCGLLYLDIDLTLYGLLFVQYIFSA